MKEFFIRSTISENNIEYVSGKNIDVVFYACWKIFATFLRTIFWVKTKLWAAWNIHGGK